MTLHRCVTWLAVLGLVVMAGAAPAATISTTLFTPPLFPDGESQLDCYLVNVSDVVRNATIEVLTREGQVLKTAEVTLAPGTEEVASVPANENPRYCKFVVEGVRAQFRASILVRSPGLGSISALPAE